MGRLEESFDRPAVRAIEAAVAQARMGEPASKLGVFDSSLLSVPLVHAARERPAVHALWLDHVHFRATIYHALNEALVTQIAALSVLGDDKE